LDFHETEPYYDNPLPSVVYLELDLNADEAVGQDLQEKGLYDGY
jgi:hypothetical protein